MTIHTAREYQSKSPEDQRKFDKWLDKNAGISSIFAIGLLVMAWAAIVLPYQINKDVVAAVSTSMGGE